MCPERMTLPRGIVALRVLPADSGAPPAPAAPAGCVALPPAELKEIQRRAFERGRATEQKELAARLGGLLASVSAAVSALDAMRERERAGLSEFGVEVALAVAEQLVGTSIRAGTHDVARLVDATLEEALPGLGQGAIQLAVNPADFEAASGVAERGVAHSVAGRLHLVADPAVDRGACRVRCGGAEILADPKLRLAAIAEKLRSLAASERVDA